MDPQDTHLVFPSDPSRPVEVLHSLLSLPYCYLFCNYKSIYYYESCHRHDTVTSVYDKPNVYFKGSQWFIWTNTHVYIKKNGR